MPEDEESSSPATAETLAAEQTTASNVDAAPSSILHAGGISRPNQSQNRRCVSFGEDVEECQRHKDHSCTGTEERAPKDEEEGAEPTSVKPALLSKDRRQASIAAMNSFRDSISTLHVDECTSRSNRWKPWASWSIPRLQWTAFGCVSSVVVLSVRLLLDTEPTAYLIHSIIVFLDMVLIHLFTNSPWLSVCGEVLTIIFFLAFHFTKETLFELLETTLIAVLCSFHLILSRNKHKERNQALQTDLDKLRQSSMYLLRNMDTIDPDEIIKLEDATVGHSVRTAPGGMAGWLAPLDREHYKEKLKVVGENFFEHFLDGSAGVMYTSFLGLIIDELLTYGQPKSY